MDPPEPDGTEASELLEPELPDPELPDPDSEAVAEAESPPELLELLELLLEDDLEPEPERLSFL